MESKVKESISEKLFNLFVINTHVVGVQMPDGKYIPQKIPFSAGLIYNMLQQGASIGTYQQQYYRDVVKWICLDFDLKKTISLEQKTLVDDEDFRTLIGDVVCPFISLLRDKQITCLTEFSGRRGIHVWILMEGVISKNTAFGMLEKLAGDVIDQINEDERFGLDLFPATGRGHNKYGKQVKMPLSVHRKGGQSFFIQDICNESIENWLNYPKKENFWELQNDILENYETNSPINILQQLKIKIEPEEKKNYQLYRREYALVESKFTINQLIQISKDCKVLHRLFVRTTEGTLSYLDRLVLVGTFYHIDNGNMLLDFFSLQKNYKEDVTKREIERFKDRYYPITLMFLYDLYKEELEPDIDGNMTVLEYLGEKLGLQLETYELQILHDTDNDCARLKNIRDKELQYMKYDDEVVSVSDYLQLEGMCYYDFYNIHLKIQKIIAGKEMETVTQKYSVYERYENGKDVPRRLVSLNVNDRVLTTALLFEFVGEIRWQFDSFSYNINPWSDGSIFFPWYSSWQRFRKEVEMYLSLSLFKDYGLLKLDLKNFYDSIYFHAIYAQMEKILEKHTKQIEKVKNIMEYLGRYTEVLMKEITGNVRGVPQGPAYARVLAELFLSTILTEFKRAYYYTDDTCRLFRYVDDIYIVFQGIDGEKMMQQLTDFFSLHGLNINVEKSMCYPVIGKMTYEEKAAVFGDGNWNYIIRSVQDMELDDEDAFEEHILEFEKYIRRKGEWDIKDANFILNGYIDKKYVDKYLDEYGIKLIKEYRGRGSIFKRLYIEIFKREEWKQRFFRKQLYKLIPLKSVNFKNFISECYLNCSQLKELYSIEKEEFIIWLEGLTDLTIEEHGTISTICQYLK